MRALRWVLWLIVAGAATAVVAVVAALLLTDAEDYRGRIERAISEVLDREVSLRGEIGVSLFPWLGFEVGDLRVGNPAGFPDSVPPVLEARRVELRVKLLPLLRRELRLDTVRLEGLRLRLVRLKDGRSNFERFGKTEASPAGGRAGGAGDAGVRPTLAAFALAGLVVREGELAYEDRRAGRRVRIAPLELETGLLAPGRPVPVRLVAGFETGPPRREGRLTVTGEVLPDPAGAHAVRGLRLDVRLAGAGLPPAGISLEAEGGGQLEPAADRLRLAPLTLRVAGARLRLTEARLERLSSAPRLVGSLALARTDLRALLAALGSAPPRTADPEALTAVALSARIWASAAAVELKRLAVELDGSRITGEAAVRGLDGRRPKYLARLAADRLDLDRYLPPPVQGRGRHARGAAGTAAGAVLLPADLLRTLRADVELRVRELKAGGLRSSALRLVLRAEGGRIRLHPVTARLYGGTYRGDVRIDATGREPVVRLDERLEAVRLEPLLRDLAGFDRLTGTGTVRARLTARGVDPIALRRTLAGEVVVALRDGAVRGVNLAALLREAKALLRGEPAPATVGPEQTDYTEITATGRIRDGVLRNEDLLGKSPFLRITGRGTVDLVRGRVDYRLRAAVVSTAKGQGGEGLDELRGVPIPLRIKGPLAGPSVRLDTRVLLKEARKRELERKREKLERKLRERFGEELGGTLERRLKELLR